MLIDGSLPAKLSKPGFIDIHRHQPSGTDALEIISIDTADFASQILRHNYYSLGLHPWFIAGQVDWFNKMTSALADPKLLAIGECGLDKIIAIDLPTQIEIFSRQIEFSEQTGKPLIIHCVKAFNELIQLKKTRKSASSWIIHGFNHKPAVAKQLLKHGCYLSFGKALLKPASNAEAALAQTPIERIFLETDAAADIPISAIYAAAAKILGLDSMTLQQQIQKNFQRVFIHD